jgi:hypothetical protein
MKIRERNALCVCHDWSGTKSEKQRVQDLKRLQTLLSHVHMQLLEQSTNTDVGNHKFVTSFSKPGFSVFKLAAGFT